MEKAFKKTVLWSLLHIYIYSCQATSLHTEVVLRSVINFTKHAPMF